MKTATKAAKTTRYGMDLDIFEHSLNHIKACDPITMDALKGWMVWQLIGVDESNIDRIADEFVRYCTTRRLVEVDNDGDIYAVYR